MLWVKRQEVYKGEWVDDVPNGRGVLYRHSDKYFLEGHFKDGIPDSNGNCRIRYSNGDAYEGSISHSKRHGKGKLYYN